MSMFSNYYTKSFDCPAFITTGWTAEKYRNLIFTLHSKGNLLSKVCGCNFSADEDWCLAHKKDDALDYFTLVNATGEGTVLGLSFFKDFDPHHEEVVTFSGFKRNFIEWGDDEVFAVTTLFEKLIAYIDDDKHQRVQIKKDESENEKYAFRCWITRLGWTENDKKNKAARAFLYSKLNGHVAFKTKEDEAKWKEAQASRKHD